jgi:hypothetical protein
MWWPMRYETTPTAARCAAMVAVAAASMMHASPAFAGAAGSDGPGGTVTWGTGRRGRHARGR